VQFLYAEGLAMGVEAANEAMASAQRQIEDAVAA
jgi:FMN-dependent NADH-azoreductase